VNLKNNLELFWDWFFMKPCQTLYKENTQARKEKETMGHGPKSKQTNSPKEANHREGRKGNH
jgi:hypothetical protein